MSDANPGRGTWVVAVAALVEVGAGVVLLADPTLVIDRLLWAALAGGAASVARVAGLALLALGLVCWPSGSRGSFAVFLGLLVYNAGVALYLAYLNLREQIGGSLLWPAVAAHGLIALLLVLSRRKPAHAE
jgi:uncharacterized membrane protein HdeD (DUF308 family)